MKKIDLNNYVEKAVAHYWNSHSVSSAVDFFNRATIIDELAIALNSDFENDGDSDFKTMMETFFEADEIEDAITGFYEMFSDNVSQLLCDRIEEKE